MEHWKEFKFEEYTLKVDVEKTKEANKKVPLSNEQCTCDHCENFSLASSNASMEFVDLLTSLGLEIRRTSEVYTSGFNNNMYNYHGFYHLVGTLETKDRIQPNDDTGSLEIKSIQISNDSSIYFTDDCSLVPESFPKHYLQLEFSIQLPRVLSYPYVNQAIPSNKVHCIKHIDSTFKSKQIRKTLFGLRYEVTFLSNNKNVVLHVNEDLFDYFDLGWSGEISFYDKTCCGIKPYK
jgi:hypothetical protein